MHQCSICQSDKLKQTNHITFGLWKVPSDTSPQLIRDTADYPIVECESCSHVQVAAQYNDSLFNTLYFHAEQSEVTWHESLLGNYQAYYDMVKFTISELETCQHIADFGCGPGGLLSAFHYWFNEQDNLDSVQLHGIDFNPRCTLDFVQYNSADLNDTSAVKACAIDQGFDLVCSSHVLEHMLYPVQYLASLKDTLSPNGKVFIEVPDFSHSITRQIAGQTNLVNMQHIQYFTAKTLSTCVQKAGLQVVKIKQVTTGYIPRLMVLLSKRDDTKPDLDDQLASMCSHKASTVITQFVQDIHDKRLAFVNTIEKAVSEKRQVGLWGIGSDFYLMKRDIKKFSDLLESPFVSLFDYEHAGKQIEDKQILNSNEIPDFSGSVYILPTLLETRDKLNKVSELWETQVIDTWVEDMLDVDGLVEQGCQICQSAQWRVVDTLNTGVWENEGNVLKRDELALTIGECQNCKHTQMMTPYSRQTFEKLYFSNDSQPEMWHTAANQADPYQEMVDFIKAEVSSVECAADFGCGEGSLMRTMQKGVFAKEVLGFDFHIVGQSNDIQRVACDLNSTQSIKDCEKERVFDLVTTSHVLEHVINPIMFLHAIASRLSENGKLFIEVPDASACNRHLQLHSNNLVHGQHIHYYTRDSLEKIAARAGLKMCKVNQLVTGDIPRLQMLFVKNDHIPKFYPDITESAFATVNARFEQFNRNIGELYQKTIKALSTHKKIALWGVGGDFYQLTKQYPDITSLIENESIVLFDASHKGLVFCGNTIKDSANLAGSELPVVITPMYWPTRAKMLELAKTWSIQIFV